MESSARENNFATKIISKGVREVPLPSKWNVEKKWKK